MDEPRTSTPPPYMEPPKQRKDVAFGDFIRVVMTLAAIGLFVAAGLKMLDIQSQGSIEGNVSINEVFYQAMGFFSFGMAALSALVGLPRR